VSEARSSGLSPGPGFGADSGWHLVLAAGIGVTGYVLTSWWLGGTIFRPSRYDYYTLLMDAVADGHLWITPGQRSPDLVTFEARNYMYWGPTPLLFVAPFFLIRNGLQHDVAYTLAAGSVNIVVFLLMMREAARSLGVTLTAQRAGLVALLFAFASPQFYLSMQGRIWHTNQVIATLYFLLFLWCFFRFVNRVTLVDLTLAVFFFNLTWVARMSYLATAPLLVYAAWHAWRQNPALAIRGVALSLSLSALTVAGWAAYNHARFGTFTETGYSYMNHARRFQEGVRTGALWHVRYIPHNSYHYFARVPMSVSKREFVLDVEGSSIFCFYPWTTLAVALPLFWKRIARPARPLMWFVVGVASVQMVSLLSFFSTGWTQVGARYFLDAVPLLFVSLLPVFEPAPRLLLILFALAGGVLSLAGMMIFYSFP
jgi:hypothetical protein